MGVEGGDGWSTSELARADIDQFAALVAAAGHDIDHPVRLQKVGAE